MTTARQRILHPYMRRVDDTRHKMTRALLITGLILFAVITGFVIGVFGIYGWMFPAIPVVLMALLALWIAPDQDSHLDDAIMRFYFMFVGLALIWPNYIAFDFSGLPWISFRRIFLFIIYAVGLYAIATSPRLRGQVGDVLKSQDLILRLFLGWVAIQFVMALVPLGATAMRWVHYQMIWNLFFIMSALVLLREGNPTRLFRMFLVGAAFSCLLVIPEVYQRQPIFAPYIPTWLGVDPDILETIASDQARADGVYRARSIYGTSVTFAENFAIFVPLALFAMVKAPSKRRLAAAVMLFLLLFVAAVLTNARTGMVAFVVAIPPFALLWIVRRYREKTGTNDMVAAAALFAFPAAALSFGMMILFWERARVRVLGGGMHQASSDGRDRQWAMAMDKLLENPLGYGVDRAGRVVQFFDGNGRQTIDNYYINLLMDYGVLGTGIWLAFFITAIYVAVRVYLKAETFEEELAAPAAVAILGMLIVRSVVSTEGTQWMGFAMAAMILALHYRQTVRARTRGLADAAPPNEQAFAGGMRPGLVLTTGRR